jgi:hypothetical protein
LSAHTSPRSRQSRTACPRPNRPRRPHRDAPRQLHV